MNVEQELLAILEKRNKSGTPLRLEMRIAELDVDSLDFVEIMFEIEETFDVHLRQSNEDARGATLADLSRWIAEARAEEASKAAAKRAAAPAKSGTP